MVRYQLASDLHIEYLENVSANDLIKKYNALIFVQQDNTKYLVVNKNSKKEDLKKFKDELDLSILF